MGISASMLNVIESLQKKITVKVVMPWIHPELNMENPNHHVSFFYSLWIMGQTRYGSI
jgi:hypothetical protein